ncbi:hypothetical protein DFS33DRAFT_9648 [Desarmillaria ectypa]|nr:hypothetical protein DFS33DRAFT_9648 [Desarmillaria ectypa]
MFAATIIQARVPPSFPGMKYLVEFMFDDHLSPTNPNKTIHHFLHSPFDLVCDALAHGLRTSTQQVYQAFRKNQCLENWGWNPFRPSIIDVVQGYTAGGMDQEAVGYFFWGENPFVMCRILALGGMGGCRACILPLARLQPEDPLWDTCRFGLRELMGEGKHDFFASQRKRRPKNGPYEMPTCEEMLE